MIVVDTGPLVALFDVRDPSHEACRATARGLREELVTTVPVLTEAARFLGASSRGFRELATIVRSAALAVEFLSPEMLARIFELMEKYADRALDFADASLIVTAETRGTRRVWSLDAADFSTYRLRRGHSFERFEIVS